MSDPNDHGRRPAMEVLASREITVLYRGLTLFGTALLLIGGYVINDKLNKLDRMGDMVNLHTLEIGLVKSDVAYHGRRIDALERWRNGTRGAAP